MKAGLEVYKFYLKVNNGNKKNAILEFKGVQKSKKVRDIVDKILVIEKELKWCGIVLLNISVVKNGKIRTK